MDYSYGWGPHLHWLWMVLLLFFVLMCAFVFRRICRTVGCGRHVSSRACWMRFGCCGPRQGPRAGGGARRREDSWKRRS